MFYNWKNAYTIGSLRNFDPLKQYFLITPKEFSDRPLNVPQECLVSTYCAHIYPEGFPTTVAQLCPHLTEDFDHPLIDEALIVGTSDSKHYSCSELLFLTAESGAFISTKQERQNTNTNPQSVSNAQVTSSAKVFKNNFENDQVIDQLTDFQKTLDLFKQIEELIEPYRDNNS